MKRFNSKLRALKAVLMSSVLVCSLVIPVFPVLAVDSDPYYSTNQGNPYLPLWEYIPDGEPYVFEDPDNPGEYRAYIYGSHDVMKTGYCG